MNERETSRPARSLASRVKRLLSGSLLNKAYIAEIKLQNGLRAALSSHSRGTVVDVGCGSKPFESLIVGHPDVKRYVGMECSGAVDPFGQALTNVEVFGDAQALPMDSDFADVILCSEVLEHVPEPERAMREAYRVLKQDGVYILTVPSTFKLHMEPHDYHRFTVHGLRYMLSKVGFYVLEVQCRGRAPAALGQSLVSYVHEVLVLRRSTGQPSLWRAPLVLPFLGVIQGLALVLDSFASSESFTIGYIVISRKPKSVL